MKSSRQILWTNLLPRLAALASAIDADPISIQPSYRWDGDDGSWSTFQVEVGSPAQTVRLLPGTSANGGSATWVINPVGCDQQNPNLSGCAEARGGIFYANQSTSWSTQGLVNGIDGAIYSLNTWEESFLGKAGNGSYGHDTLTLGPPGSNAISLSNQLIAGIWTNDYFIGSLGLSPFPTNPGSLNSPQQSMLGTLRNQSLVPSASWAYTAGARYKTPPVFGSLTLGGYDTTRFTADNVTANFSRDYARALALSLRSITYDTAGSSPLMATSIDVFIDSMVTELWLPTTVCQEFANRFNLSWNSQAQRYFVSESAHTALLASNPTFTFTLGQLGGSGQTVEISLPYAAFDLNVTAPIVGRTVRYFPLKQAQNDSQYALGRTFLQEAYIIADYERNTFSVSQALFPPSSTPPQIFAITSPGSVQTTRGGLTTGAIIGIAIAAGALIAAVSLVVWWLRRRARHQQFAHTALKQDFGGSTPARECSEAALASHEQDGLLGASGRDARHEVDGLVEAVGDGTRHEVHGHSLELELSGQNSRLEMSGPDRGWQVYELEQRPHMYEIAGREMHRTG